ncbi:MAG: hypothetical protein ACNA8W_16215 [Bradymonadaceae bacterium]
MIQSPTRLLLTSLVFPLLFGCPADPDTPLIQEDSGPDAAFEDITPPQDDAAQTEDVVPGDDVVHTGCPEAENLTVTDASQLPNIAACDTIPGDLIIEVPLGVATLSFPALQEVGGELIIRLQDTMTTLDLPILEKVGALVISENEVLETIEIPGIQEIVERLGILSNAALQSVRFESLWTIGESLDAQSLIPAMNIWNNPDLVNLNMPALKEVHGGIGLNVHDNESLEALSFPVLEVISTELVIANMANLETISFPALTFLGRLFIVMMNPKLPTCSLHALLSDIVNQPPERICIMGNADDACEDDLSGCN